MADQVPPGSDMQMLCRTQLHCAQHLLPACGMRHASYPLCSAPSCCCHMVCIPLLSACAGSFGCVAVPPDCGVAPGSTCCPNLYSLASNPLLPNSGCSGNSYCNHNAPTAVPYPGSSLLPERPGVCAENSSDCGQLGKACCVNNDRGFPAVRCVPEDGSRGYCADSTGLTLSQGAKESDLVCTACPAVVDEDLRTKNSDLYFRCKTPGSQATAKPAAATPAQTDPSPSPADPSPPPTDPSPAPADPSPPPADPSSLTTDPTSALADSNTLPASG
jgi:hypothetical protein